MDHQRGGPPFPPSGARPRDMAPGGAPYQRESLIGPSLLLQKFCICIVCPHGIFSTDAGPGQGAIGVQHRSAPHFFDGQTGHAEEGVGFVLGADR